MARIQKFARLTDWDKGAIGVDGYPGSLRGPRPDRRLRRMAIPVPRTGIPAGHPIKRDRAGLEFVFRAVRDRGCGVSGKRFDDFGLDGNVSIPLMPDVIRHPPSSQKMDVRVRRMKEI